MKPEPQDRPKPNLKAEGGSRVLSFRFVSFKHPDSPLGSGSPLHTLYFILHPSPLGGLPWFLSVATQKTKQQKPWITFFFLAQAHPPSSPPAGQCLKTPRPAPAGPGRGRIRGPR
jgi:hypothetical protein